MFEELFYVALTPEERERYTPYYRCRPTFGAAYTELGTLGRAETIYAEDSASQVTPYGYYH